MPRQTTLERLQQLARELELPEPTSYKRHYPGHWQRSGGAWSWSAYRDGLEVFGSPDPLLLCLQGAKRSWIDRCPAELHADKKEPT